MLDGWSVDRCSLFDVCGFVFVVVGVLVVLSVRRFVVVRGVCSLCDER